MFDSMDDKLLQGRRQQKLAFSIQYSANAQGKMTKFVD